MRGQSNDAPTAAPIAGVQKVARRMIRGRLMTKPRLRATLRIVIEKVVKGVSVSVTIR